MESILIALFNNLGNSSGFSLIISAISLIIGGWLFFRKTNIDHFTSVGSLQQKQIKSLLDQIDFLSNELVKARSQLAEIHDQNIQLMEQIRESNKRIQELEIIIGHSRRD
jgi:TolA-binding protein